MPPTATARHLRLDLDGVEVFNRQAGLDDAPANLPRQPLPDQGRSLWKRLVAMWAGLAERAAQHRLYWDTLDELHSLSDRELADNGLQRSEVRGVVGRATFGALAKEAGPDHRTP